MSHTASQIKLAFDTSVPIYQQLKDAISQQIHSGRWQPGEQIPSENQLAAELGASRMTVTRSLRELTADGLLSRVHGVGTFVAEPPRQASLIELRSIAEEIRAQGKTHRAKILVQQAVQADATIAKRMAVSKQTKVSYIEVVHFQDDVPIQLEQRFVNMEKVPAFLQTDFTLITPSEYLISQIRPDELEHIVQAIVPDAATSKLLDIPCSEPCLRLKRRTWHNNDVVTTVDMSYPSSRYDLGARYQPNT